MSTATKLDCVAEVVRFLNYDYTVLTNCSSSPWLYSGRISSHNYYTGCPISPESKENSVIWQNK
jgi:hypothetical protein